jgi:hypothetical protein
MKNSSTISTVGTLVLTICALITLSTSSFAQQGNGPSLEGRCSNRTLVGSYGFTITGTIVGPGLEIRGVAMQKYDGNGNFTQVDHVVASGFPPQTEWRPGTGTYTVNADCTGSALLTIPNDPSSPVSIHFVVDGQGREIRQVVDGQIVTATGTRLD